MDGRNLYPWQVDVRWECSSKRFFYTCFPFFSVARNVIVFVCIFFSGRFSFYVKKKLLQPTRVLLSRVSLPRIANMSGREMAKSCTTQADKHSQKDPHPLADLPRHRRAAAPHPPAHVKVHLHVNARTGNNRDVLWNIITEPCCGWSVFDYTFSQVNACKQADVCVDIQSNTALVHTYGREANGLSITDYEKIPPRIWLNRKNWNRIPQASSFRDLDTYRRYLVNHELGHAVVGLGHAGTETCWGTPSGSQTQETTKNRTTRGMTAPIMLQQTRGIGPYCKKHSWWIDLNTVADPDATEPDTI